MATSPLHCEVLSIPVTDGFVRIMVICIDTPSSSQNLFDRTFSLEIGKAVIHANELANSNDIDMLVLCSGKDTFIAGADIKNLLSYIGNRGGLRSFSDVYKLNYVYCMLETISVPTITIISGTVLGAGLELVMSCDYRVINSSLGKQIGLPEVKIGVLPGAGGCMRLPYLIGLRQSLPMLLTGSPIDPKKALKLGLMDDLWANTRSTRNKEGEKTKYHYQWISKLTECINTGRIGRKSFPLIQQLSNTGRIRKEQLGSMEISLPDLSEQEMLDKVKISWVKVEEKASTKYHRRAIAPSVLSPLYHSMDMMLYIISAVKLYQTIGHTIPSPYQALLCTWNCYHATSIQDGVVECTARFARLNESAESKNLMSLFLLASVLKKQALGNGPPRTDNDVIVLLNGDGRGLTYGAQFVQSLLYGDIRVGVMIVNTSNGKVWQQLTAAIKNQFKYSTSRGHMTEENVRAKMEGLKLLDSIPEQESTLIVNGCLNGTIIPCKVSCNIVPTTTSIESGSVPMLHLGDPVRKNTLSIEISTTSNDTTPSDVVMRLSSIASRLGKTPVITPRHSHIGWRLAFAHWSLAVKVVMEMGVRVEYLEKALKDGGFTEGPFTTMKKFDKDVLLSSLEELCNDSVLVEYVRNPPIIRYRATSKLPSPQSLRKLFIANMVLAGSSLLTQYSEVADAIDFLSVSGLVHFPPTEGGPISFLKRNDRSVMINSLRKMQCSNQMLKDHANRMADEIDRLIITGSSLSLLTDNELVEIGPCHGVRDLPSIVYPFPFNRQYIYLMVGSLLIVCGAIVLLYTKL